MNDTWPGPLALPVRLTCPCPHAATSRSVRALRRPLADWTTTHYILFGLLIADLGLLLAYQLTEGTWLGFTWVFLALLVAAGRLAEA